MAKRVRVGQIVNTQGVRGQVRVWPLTETPSRFFELKRVFVEAPTQGLPEVLTITGAHLMKKVVIVDFQEIGDMNQAERLKGCYLTIPVEEVPPPEADSYYHFQLEGLSVFTEAGEKLGQIVEILETGSNDVYVVRQSSTPGDVLIPALKSVVLKVDLDAETMTVRLPEGLR
ncbi:16S rRNA processing protein RimM [Heliobacterium gestii]|uniref:Ribosome maturation factor RimM n=1 Tax=Heliomicrobium gestii TaxID=2699 RepID=A0A845LGG6_HELGE|nr:ribosome maturation factor RimM [Heliomicrobium gestii]MBM7867060.1 16S rRNA processing protein RimM [Heliomicrobium gestii]MZP43525.1 16S rRNA processing protein RimM [Heliomicrobium gestii]